MWVQQVQKYAGYRTRAPDPWPFESKINRLQQIVEDYHCAKFQVILIRGVRGTGVRELTRGLATLPPKVDPGAFSGQRPGWKPPRRPSGRVHCFCVCSGSALLGDLLGISRSRECDLLSVLLIYPRIILHVFIAYHLLVWFLFVWLYSAICSCVLVVLVKLSVLAKWLAIERPSDDTFMRWGDYLHKARWKSVFVCIFLRYTVC